jgi:hypothetical protein
MPEHDTDAVCYNEARLRAFLEGLEVKEIDDLMNRGAPEDFRALGELMAQTMKNAADALLDVAKTIGG